MRRIFLALAFCFAAAPAFAATLLSKASGNIDATATWSVVDTTGANAYLNSETANTALTTSAVASSTFTPAAETVSAIAVKLAAVAAAPSGTITIKLANSTSAGNRECTQTVNVADLPSAAAATAEGGWVVLSCSASPNGTDAYTIQANTSVAAQVNLFSLATTNWSRFLATTGTQVGGALAGDKLIVSGVLTGAGTHSSFAVTVPTTAVVNYGNVAFTTVDPSISICQFGTLAFANAASTNYVMQFAGPLIGYNGGTFTIGTSASRIPSTSTATLTMNSTAEGDTGIDMRNGATMNSFGSPGARNNIVKTKLTATATAGSTTALTTAVATGWVSGDSVVIAGTQTTTGTLASVKDDSGTVASSSGTTLTLGAAVTNTHTPQTLSYTSTQTGIAYSLAMQPDVVLLNRNVVIQGGSSTNNGYLHLAPNSIFAADWVQFNQMSGTAVGKRGVEIDTGAAGSFSLTNFAHINSHNSAMMLCGSNNNCGGTAASYLTIQHGTLYNVASNTTGTIYGLSVFQSTYNPFWKIDNVAVMRSGNGVFSAVGVQINSQNGQLTNFSVTASGQGNIQALRFNGTYLAGTSTIGGTVGNTWGPIDVYTNVGWSVGILSYGIVGTLPDLHIWHEAGRFTPASGTSDGNLVFERFYLITGGFGIYVPGSAGAHFAFRNGVIGWDAAPGAGGFPLTDDAKQLDIRFDNMELCPVGLTGGVTFQQCALGKNNLVSLQHDVGVADGSGTTPTTATAELRNSSLANNVGTAYPTLAGEEGWFSAFSYVLHDCNACTPVTHGAWVQGGFMNYDTAISHVSGYSVRMTPRVNVFSGYIAGTALNVTSQPVNASNFGDLLQSNGGGFVAGTLRSGGSATPFTVSISQTVGSVGSPVQFISGPLVRMQSAPFGRGAKIAVNSGQAAQACVWARPSINTDAAPPWGGSAVTYTGSAPRMLVRPNPAMGIMAVTVLATSSLTAGTWSQFCGTLPTAPADGEYEVVVDADQTFTSNVGGSLNIAEWSCSNCNNANTSRYWWNGAPTDAIAPVSTGGSGGKIIGG